MAEPTGLRLRCSSANCPGSIARPADGAWPEPQKKSAVAPKSRLSGLGRFGAKPAPKSAAPSKFAVGQTVEHLFMGRGEVVRIDDAAGERRILVRFFEDGETMPIIERYGDLKPA